MAESLKRALELKETALTATADYYEKQLAVAGETPRPPKQGQKRYIVSLTVSDLTFAGTLNKVSLTLHGCMASSKSLKVSSKLSAGTSMIQYFDLPDLGELLTVDIELNSLLMKDELHLSYVVVANATDNIVTIFPCYRWIASKMTLRNGNASLAFNETNERLRTQRRAELEERQKTFKWGTNPRYAGWPGYTSEGATDVPADVQFTDSEAVDFARDTFAAGAKFGLKVRGSSKKPYTDFKDFYDTGKAMADQGDEKEVLENVYLNWSKDEEFARQYLNGQNPVVLEKCTSLPNNFPVEEELRLQGLSVDSGNLYIANYAMLDELLSPEETSKVAFYCAPICLFRMTPTGKLLPIVIQLNQKPGDDNPLWTPADGLGWLLAKIYVRNADANLHQAVTHLLKTHLVLEAFAVAMWRQLPEAHPVFKLLIPHTRSTIAINGAARSSLINDGGIFDQGMAIGIKGASSLIRRVFKKFKVQDINFPEAIKARGMDGSVSGFYFRDDGIHLFNIIREYVREVIKIYYRNDDDVVEDVELQAWMKELYSHGFPGEGDDGDHHGLTGSIATIEQLVILLTSIIFHASAGHASINFTQMAYYGFVPNAPFMMRQPAPTSKKGITMEHIMQSLPNVSDVANQLSVSYTLSRYTNGEVFLGVFPELHFSETAANEAAKKFKANLDQLDSDIIARNASACSASYPYMRPSLVPNSIAK